MVAMGLISLPLCFATTILNLSQPGRSVPLARLGQIIPPSIVLIILADQLASAADQAATARKALYKQATGQFSMPSEFSIISTSAGDMFLGAFLPGHSSCWPIYGLHIDRSAYPPNDRSSCSITMASY